MKKIIFGILVVLLISAGVWWLSKSGMLSHKTIVSTNSEVQRIKKAGVLKVGVDATFFPMEYKNDQGELAGLGIDLSQKIAKEFGVPLSLVSISWDNIFTELKNDNIDMIVSSVSITSDRSKIMSFSKPYFNAGQVLMVVSSDSTIKGITSLASKKIGFQAGTTSEIEAKKLTEKKNIFPFEDSDLATTNLLSGKIDVVILDYPVAVGKVKNNPALKIVGSPFTQEFYGIAVNRGNEGLLEPVNQVIENLIDSGDMKKLENKWLK